MTRPHLPLLLACAPLLAYALLPAHAAPPPSTPPPATSSVTLPEAQLEKLMTAYALIQRDYVARPDDDKLFDGALAGMLAALDPHSQYLNREDMRDIDRETSGDYVGIGITIEVDHERMRIVHVAAGSPAERAGIRPGEIVTAIDGVDPGGMSGPEVARRMRGAPGTRVVLALGANRSLPLTREALRDSTVSVRSPAPGLAWLRIEEFGGATGAEVTAALKKLDGAGAPRGLVLDLRNNPGGLLPSAIAVAGAFLPEGTLLFSARGRQASDVRSVTVDQRYYRRAGEDDVLAGLPAWCRGVPLVVLVNGASASAAELLAGALQDHGRARIVGARTFGKGSIQSIIPLDAGSGVKFTVARYFTPNGHEVQAHGIVPDVAAAPLAVADGGALLPREADLANHLAPVDAAAAGSAAKSAPDSAPVRAPAERTAAFGGRDDHALQAALALLAPQPAGTPATTMVARLRRLVP